MSQKQAKKRRREERSRTRQKASSQNGTAHEETRDLEELLREGNIDDYAQTCWTLANRMEGPPRVGQVITLGPAPARNTGPMSTRSGSPSSQ